MAAEGLGHVSTRYEWVEAKKVSQKYNLGSFRLTPEIRSIIIRLIAVNLLLGRLPCPKTLETYDLPQFRPLIDSFRTGNIPLWRRVLEEHREWFRRRSIWLVLYERGEILLWRNLFRQA